MEHCHTGPEGRLRGSAATRPGETARRGALPQVGIVALGEDSSELREALLRAVFAVAADGDDESAMAGFAGENEAILRGEGG